VQKEKEPTIIDEAANQGFTSMSIRANHKSNKGVVKLMKKLSRRIILLSSPLPSYDNIVHRLESGVGVRDLGVEGVEVDERTSEDVGVVRDLGSILLRGEDGVRDTLDLGEALDLASLDGEGVGSEARVDGNELALDVDGRSDGTVSSNGECWEGLDGKGGVGGWALGDEGSGDRVDAVESEGSVVRSGPSGALLDGRSQPSLVSGLGGEDGSGNSEVGGVGDGRGGTEVGRDTDVLNDGSQGGEGPDVGDGELVRTRLGGSVSESSGEDGDVRSLVLADLRDSSSDPVGETGGLEVLGRELGEAEN
jgi:hypothetical protein